MSSRDRLVALITANGADSDKKSPIPFVSLEQFFEGNDDLGSIGPSLPGDVMPSEFFSAFSHVRARPDVADVYVEILEHDDPQRWPYCDTIWVVTSATPQDVRLWLPARLPPTGIMYGFSCSRPEASKIPRGMRALGLYYD